MNLFSQSAPEYQQALNIKNNIMMVKEVDYGQLCAEAFFNLLADDIRVHEGKFPLWYDEASVYYRSDAYKSGFFKNVARILGVSFENDNFILIANVSYLNFYYPSFKKYHLIDEIGIIVLKDKTDVKNPVCGIDRMLLVETLINCGINLFKISDPKLINSAKTQNRTFDTTKIVGLSPITEAQIIKHWDKLLGNEHANFSKTLIFNSGAMANECCTLGVYQTGYKNAYFQGNWYYENKESIKLNYDCLADERRCHVFFVGLEPTNYFDIENTNLDVNAKDNVESAIMTAVYKPNENFTLVVDCTVNPLFEINSTIPHNLLIIKTVSATKHQNGDRRLFFGVCKIIGNNKQLLESLYNAILNFKQLTGAGISKMAMQHFPLPSIDELRTRIITCSEVNGTVARFCNETKTGWEVKPFTFHSFIMFSAGSKRAVLEAVQRLTQEELTKKTELWNKNLRDIVVNYTLSVNFNSIFEFGDSFGLNISRINIQGDSYTFRNRKQARIKLPRICFGYETDIESAKFFTKGLIENLSNLSL